MLKKSPLRKLLDILLRTTITQDRAIVRVCSRFLSRNLWTSLKGWVRNSWNRRIILFRERCLLLGNGSSKALCKILKVGNILIMHKTKIVRLLIRSVGRTRHWVPSWAWNSTAANLIKLTSRNVTSPKEPMAIERKSDLYNQSREKFRYWVARPLRNPIKKREEILLNKRTH